MIGEELDSWTMPITGPWSVKITVHEDRLTGDPKDAKDVYNPYLQDTDEAKTEALRTLNDWYAQRWAFVRVRVVPVLEHQGRTEEFPQFSEELYSVEWGRMTGDTPGVNDQVWGRAEIEVYPVKDLAGQALGELRRISGLLDGAFTD